MQVADNPWEIGYEPEGRVFESLWAHHKISSLEGQFFLP